MKKYLLLFMALLLYNIAYSAPSNTLSISPVAVDATTITAADENTRNNAVVTTYNAHTHTDISQTENTLNVGDALAGDKAITAYNADTNKPYLKYDDTNDYWVFSTNGVAPSAVMQGTGLIFEGATDDTFETTLSITDPTADRAITIPNNTGTAVLTGALVAQTLSFASDTISNLGTVTTADINGGTIDGVTLGGSSVVTITSAVATSITGLTTLTASGNIDIGSFNLMAQTLTSDVATGTAPLIVASTTKVTNLNADLLDGYNAADILSRQLFTSSGTFTAPDGITKVYVTMIGGGGAGGSPTAGTSRGGGGGSGAYISKYPYTVVPENNYTVTVGAGGTDVPGSTGNAGANSLFDTLTSTGGGGGGSSTSGAGGTGTSVSGTGATAGGLGLGGSGSAGVASGITGAGGGSLVGKGGIGGNPGADGTGYGSGGGGGDGSSNPAGNGVIGFCLVEW